MINEKFGGAVLLYVKNITKSCYTFTYNFNDD